MTTISTPAVYGDYYASTPRSKASRGTASKRVATYVAKEAISSTTRSCETLFTGRLHTVSTRCSKADGTFEQWILDPANHDLQVRTLAGRHDLDEAKRVLRDEASCLRLVTAVAMEIAQDWQTGKNT